MTKKFITIKLIEQNDEEKVLDEYEVGCWNMLTELFNESLAEIIRRFVDSMTNDPDDCEEIVEQLLELKQSLKRKHNNKNMKIELDKLI